MLVVLVLTVWPGLLVLGVLLVRCWWCAGCGVGVGAAGAGWAGNSSGLVRMYVRTLGGAGYAGGVAAAGGDGGAAAVGACCCW